VLLPCHCTTPAMISLIPLPYCYLWANRLKRLPCQFLILFLLLVFTAQHSCWANPFRTLGFLSLFCSLGVLSLFYSLGVLGPFHHSLPFSLPWVFVKSFGLPWPKYHILTFRAHWPLNQPHEFTNSFLWAFSTHFLLSFHLLQFSWACYFIPWASSAHLLSLWPFIILVGPLTIIPTILAKLSLFYCFLSLSFLYCWVSSAIGPFCQKWASTPIKINFN